VVRECCYWQRFTNSAREKHEACGARVACTNHLIARHSGVPGNFSLEPVRSWAHWPRRRPGGVLVWAGKFGFPVAFGSCLVRYAFSRAVCIVLLSAVEGVATVATTTWLHFTTCFPTGWSRDVRLVLAYYSTWLLFY